MTQSNTSEHIQLIDEEPCEQQFKRELLDGLQPRSGAIKTTPCKYLYDERGSALFDEICELPEYYPTRTELKIMQTHAKDMAGAIGQNALVVELGSGSSLKTRLLLDELTDPAGYVPLDISREHLAQAAKSLAKAYPEIEVLPLCADYMSDVQLPQPRRYVKRRVAYFPGSTIGNFHPDDAQQFLARLARLCGATKDRPGRGGLLIGVDLKKEVSRVEAAYNDAAGVTAAFNLNLLRRINRELDGDIDESHFEFRAIWNDDEDRVESYLISRVPQTIHIAEQPIELDAGERIRTECSYKFTVTSFAELAEQAGWHAKRIWTDEQRLFSVQYFETAR